MNSVSVVVSFLQGEMTINDRSFLEMCKTIFLSDMGTKLIPIKILFPKTGKVLYADENKFKAFINHELSCEELIAAVQCDDLFRNSEDLFIQDHGVTIEEGSLWMKRGYECILIHEDEHITHIWNESKFNKFFS